MNTERGVRRKKTNECVSSIHGMLYQSKRKTYQEELFICEKEKEENKTFWYQVNYNREHLQSLEKVKCINIGNTEEAV